MPLLLTALALAAEPNAVRGGLSARLPALRGDAAVEAKQTAPTLQSDFDGADVSFMFDDPVAQEASFAITGAGLVRDVRCDDAWATVYVSRDAECARPEKGALSLAGNAWMCVRVEPAGFVEGGVGVCRASTSTGAWVMRYTMSAP